VSKAGKALTVSIILASLLGVVVVLVTMRTDDAERKVEDSARLLDKFRALPYAMVGDEDVDSAKSGVLFHDPSKSFRGYNFYCSKIAPTVWLIDMAGRPVHEWESEGPGKLKYAIMLTNGDVLMLHRFLGLRRFDWNSELIWSKMIRAHHDVTELPDGSFYALSTETVRYRGLMVTFPVIIHLSSNGDEIRRWSSNEHMEEIKSVFDLRSFLDTRLDSLLAETDSAALYAKLKEGEEDERVRLGGEKRFASFHANTVGVLPATPSGLADERFREGNVLVCFRNVNQIAVLDSATWKVLWAWGEGELQWPHDPTMLESGNILIFDNGVDRKYSRIVELNPISGEIEWQYVADPPESFYSEVEGSSQRLPNGNTLICESAKGHVFEVTSDGEIVWDWLNPEIENGRRVRVYRMIRLPVEVIDPLLVKN
jgi:hypothetical protein